jgi:tRNA modification GTPase
MLRVIQLTPPGRGAIATLSIEGPGATAAVQADFHARGDQPLETLPPDRLALGRFGGDLGEEVVVRRRSEDAIELHCHGGLAAIEMIERALVAAGCQKVGWRQWADATHADPVAAAALSALADARTQRTASILLDQYHGALSRAMNEIRQAIGGGRDDAARRQIEVLLGRAILGRHLVQPWRVVLAGSVNVGKSSLINALAGYARSIVHPLPGTTRDAVTVTTAIDGWPVELCDTAGLRRGRESCVGWTPPVASDSAVSAHPTRDPVEHAGIQLARERLAQADLAILVFDHSTAWSAEDQTLCDQWPNGLRVYNKCDLPSAPGPRPAGLRTSALRGDGIDELLAAVARRLVPDPPPPGAAVPFTINQIETIERLLTVGRSLS